MLAAGIGASHFSGMLQFLLMTFAGREFCANIIKILFKIRHIKTKFIIKKCKIYLLFVYIF